MAITQVGSAVTQSNAANNVAGNLVVNVPTGVQDGDVIVAFVYKAVNATHSLTAPGGWTQIGTNQDSTNIQASAWWRIASSEPASYTWTISSTGIWGVCQVAFRGAHPTSPIHTSAQNASTTTDPYSCPNVTTTVQCNILSFGASRDDSVTEVTHTAAGVSELADWGFDGGASTRNGAVYFNTSPVSAGTITGLSINPSGSITNSARFTVALRVLQAASPEAEHVAVDARARRTQAPPGGTHGATLLVYQTSPQSIPDSTDTAVVWDTEQVNTGPANWWDSGSASDIVIPWVGPYLVTVAVLFNEVTTGRRCIHLTRGTSLSTESFVCGMCIGTGTTSEANSQCRFSGVVYLSSGIHRLAAWQNSGGSLPTEVNHGYPYTAYASFTYLGG